MSKYDYLVEYASECGAEVVELDLGTNKPCGKCVKNILVINKNITTYEKLCILSEELGHYKTTVGDITNQTKISNRKQELKARAWGYDKIIGLNGLINAFNCGCKNPTDIAEFFNVTQEYLNDAIIYYTSKYGLMYKLEDYTIFFSPNLQIVKSN
ncbi:ImmA/IrrE family metallo-endopeptidase [Paraclostridium sordellii]|uniref:ImmA/IrrE family metallo-endopeptidase n=1 Tax=Paraclostridium sordellii TaxID=1505 RepID=UPI0005E0D5DC|nr:ImmA/IrrE family metallo-endopeptidase [Paeniclostridium sordellii]CEN21241.1 phage protein [[Clostridium] sordellii] [Paeniclostridium sordellii]